jgi:hypothetical protein
MPTCSPRSTRTKPRRCAPADFFEMIGDKVREKYKDRLAVNDDDDDAPTPRRKVLSPVEGRGPRRPRGGKTGADLPPDAQKTADRFIRMGIIKTRDEYAKTYFGVRMTEQPRRRGRPPLVQTGAAPKSRNLCRAAAARVLAASI